MKKICGWCRSPFEYEARPDDQIRSLKENLLISDEKFVPIICDTCLQMTGVGRVDQAFILRH
jgi:hypothetical protein